MGQIKLIHFGVIHL